MNSITRCILAAVCGVLLMTGPSDAAQQKERPESYPMPEIKKDCTTCHLDAVPQTGGELKKGLSALCLDCHPDRKAPAEHKVDMVPPMKVKGLPLTDGKMTCATCHDPHRNLHGKLLRMNPRDLCIVCHPL
jgi:predicted CXXCH cytochrome family protein